MIFLPDLRPGKILIQNSLKTLAARGHCVCAFLAESEAVTKATAAKDEIRSGPSNFESRALQNTPSQNPADDDLEIPTANKFAVLACESNELRPPGCIALAHQNLIEPGADVGASIALQCAQ